MKFLLPALRVAWALLLAVPLVHAAALSPRSDINPALLYFQGINAMPTLSADDSRQLLDDPPSFSQEEGTKISARYDPAFRCFRRAARMRATCDWGTDVADGPDAFTPNLVKIRQIAQAGVARAHYAVRGGRADEAVEDVLAVLALGRNTAIDGTLVTTMFGVAVDNRVLSFVATHLAAFPPRALETLARGIDDAPARTTVKQAMMGEETMYVDWLLARLDAIRAARPGDEGRAVKEFKSVLARMLGGVNGDEAAANEVVQAAGNTLQGVAEYVNQMRSVYAEVGKLAEASPEDLPTQSKQLEKLVAQRTNVLVRLLLPTVGKARGREIETIARLAMVRAAIERKLHGEEGFKAVADPFGSGPFVLRQFREEDNVRGIELESQIALQGLQGTMRFPEGKETE